MAEASRTVHLVDDDESIRRSVSFMLRTTGYVVKTYATGVEFLSEREFNSFNFSKESNSGYYIGPTLHYGGKKFFVTAAFLTQLPLARTHSESVDGAIVDGRTLDNDFEKYRVRIKAGYYF